LVDQDIIKLRLEELKKVAFTVVNAADSLKRLDEIEIEFLGRKGKITAIIREISSLDISLRPVSGRHANAAKNDVEDLIKRKREEIKK
jgi:phenylalanyl-tRNA synthetase alpha chain